MKTNRIVLGLLAAALVWLDVGCGGSGVGDAQGTGGSNGDDGGASAGSGYVCPTPECSGVVTFADPNLEQRVRDALQMPAGDLTHEDVLQVTELGNMPPDSYWTTYGPVEDLGGIECLQGLERLSLYGQEGLTDLGPLCGLTSLTQLSISGDFNDLSPLAGLTSLTSLSLGGNGISDLTPLAGLTSLIELLVGGNAISDLSPLSGLTSLTTLHLEENAISDLSPVAGLTSLTEVWLQENDISDLSPLEAMTELTYLRLSNNAITDLSPLSGMTALTELDLERNDISDLSPLAGLDAMTRLFLSDNAITDVSPLAGMTLLDALYLAQNNVSDLSPLEGMTLLYELNLENNNISDLGPLVANEGLVWGDNSVWVRGNPIDCEAQAENIARLHDRVELDTDCVPVDMEFPPPEPDCEALAPLASGLRIADQAAQKMLFTVGLDRVVLLVDAGLLIVDLPSGETSIVQATGVSDIELLHWSREEVVGRVEPDGMAFLPVNGIFDGYTVHLGICGHVVSEDRTRLYDVSECTDGVGVLYAWDLTTDLGSQPAAGVPAETLIVSPDGAWATYQTAALSDQPCPEEDTNLQIVSADGQAGPSLAHTSSFGPQFLADGRLLAGRALSCDDWELVLYAPERDELTPLASNASPSYHPWQVSLERQIALGEHFDLTASDPGPGELVAISLTGEGETVLASDLFLYHAVQTETGLYHAFALTADGQYAVYESDSPRGLSAVPTNGGPSFLLSEYASGYSYSLSPFAADQILLVERVGESPDVTDEIRLGSVSSGTSRLLYTAATVNTIPTPPEHTFLPDGRGLVLLDDQSRLLFAPAEGEVIVLSEDVSIFEVDDTGCVAAYVTQAPDPATYVGLIPQNTP